jgi:hypothetical protein
MFILRTSEGVKIFEKKEETIAETTSKTLLLGLLAGAVAETIILSLRHLK